MLAFCKKLKLHCFPPTCILCKQASDTTQDLCSPCRNELPILPESCPRCANSLLFDPEKCQKCRYDPPPYDTAFVLFSYEGPIPKLIMELKFHQSLIYGRILGELMAETLAQKPQPCYPCRYITPDYANGATTKP